MNTHTNGWDAGPADLPPVLSATNDICHACGQIIVGEVHPDHERWCNAPEAGCECALVACAACCEWCEREDFPTAAEWLVDKMTMEHPTAGRALINACWVLRTVRSGSLPGLRAVWTEIVTTADILVEIEAAVADAGWSLDTIDWKELRHRWYDAAKLLHEAGDLDMTLALAPEVHIMIDEPPAAEPTPWPNSWRREGVLADGGDVYLLA